MSTFEPELISNFHRAMDEFNAFLNQCPKASHWLDGLSLSPLQAKDPALMDLFTRRPAVMRCYESFQRQLLSDMCRSLNLPAEIVRGSFRGPLG